MKKIFFRALLVLVLTGLSMTSASALEPGCSPEAFAIQKNNSDAARTREKAYGRQIIKQNDPALALTCFDQQLKLTSRLGLIFSDIIPSSSVVSNTASSTPWSLTINPPTLSSCGISMPSGGFSLQSDRGATNLLSEALGHVAAPEHSMDCQRSADLWSNNAVTGNTSIEGNGVQTGTPYVSMLYLLSGGFKGMGADFISQLGNDSAILNAAMADLTDLSTPGSTSFWPASPSFPDTADITTIIGSMP